MGRIAPLAWSLPMRGARTDRLKACASFTSRFSISPKLKILIQLDAHKIPQLSKTQGQIQQYPPTTIWKEKLTKASSPFTLIQRKHSYCIYISHPQCRLYPHNCHLLPHRFRPLGRLYMRKHVISYKRWWNRKYEVILHFPNWSVQGKIHGVDWWSTGCTRLSMSSSCRITLSKWRYIIWIHAWQRTWSSPHTTTSCCPWRPSNWQSRSMMSSYSQSNNSWPWVIPNSPWNKCL